MSKSMTWLKRSAVVAVGSAAVLTVVSTPSLAANSLSTTGAYGSWAYAVNGTWSMSAKDTLTDGHCAQWERKPAGSSSWTTSPNEAICSSTLTWSGIAQSGDYVRICRTGVWNCSGSVKL